MAVSENMMTQLVPTAVDGTLECDEKYNGHSF